MGKSKTSNNKDLEYKIIKIHGYVNDSKSKILATVKWGDNDPTLDIRRCRELDDGTLQLLKGISIQKHEFHNLDQLIQDIKITYDSQDDIFSEDEDIHAGRHEVNFDKVFDSAGGIMEKREAGYTTKDGFIKLVRKHSGLR